MILSNVEIVRAIELGRLRIDQIAGMDPALPPFNTSSVDLRLAPRIAVPKRDETVTLRPSKGRLAKILTNNSQQHEITSDRPFLLQPNCFILGQTRERVAFPIQDNDDGLCYSARVEGKSSLARCGVLVHFTAPTVHAGFEGTITLEIINLGPYDILLEADTYICQLIVEEVKGIPVLTPSQFRGQNTPTGV
jgi:dCTP deaminase